MRQNITLTKFVSIAVTQSEQHEYSLDNVGQITESGTEHDIKVHVWGKALAESIAVPQK